MTTLNALVALLRDAARLLARFWPKLAAWYCLGWGINTLMSQVSTVLGGERWLVLSTSLFIIGVVAWVGCLVLMIHSLQPGLSEVGRGGPETAVPGTVTPIGDRTDILLSVLGPVIAVYSAWGLAEDQVAKLLTANLALHGLDARSYSINLSQFRFWLGVAVVAWVVKRIAGAIDRRKPGNVPAGVELVADGASVLALFVVINQLTSQLMDWLEGRMLWRWGAELRRSLLDLLPSLPYLDLPELVGAFLDVLPGAVADSVLYPLFWLALTAAVFGWRDFEGRDLLTGTRLESVASHLNDSPATRLGLFVTGELREKYVPVLRALRLIWASGGQFIGAYVVAVALVNLVTGVFRVGSVWWIGPRPIDQTLAYVPLLDLVTGLLSQLLLVAVYGAAFDAALRASARGGIRRPVFSGR